MVGPWCFLDRYGPMSFTSEKPMDVIPHPHIGIQTVSWLLDGELLHKDSLGYEALMRAGQVNVMTSGRGIVHSEETPRINTGRLRGVQLWVALPEQYRNMSPLFDHHAVVPEVEIAGGSALVFAGSLRGEVAPARTYSDIAGMEIRIHENGESSLPVDPEFEHAILVLDEAVQSEGRVLEPDALHYFGEGRSSLSFNCEKDARLLLIGGRPFRESILMWWNFVARTPEEIKAARDGWEGGSFGDVKGYPSARAEAPPLQLARKSG
jgi:redox-sensitive bicupin YhaK (pirin superfamily)